MTTPDAALDRDSLVIHVVNGLDLDLPALPGVDPLSAPLPDDPGYCDWVERVAFSPEGVDRMLIWRNLHRSPTQRLRDLQGVLDGYGVSKLGDDPHR